MKAAFIALILFVSASAQAETYKCKSETGGATFTLNENSVSVADASYGQFTAKKTGEEVMMGGSVYRYQEDFAIVEVSVGFGARMKRMMSSAKIWGRGAVVEYSKCVEK